MSYSTTTDCVNRIGADLLKTIQGETSAYSEAKVLASRIQAAALMDSHLCHRARTPVDTVRHSHLWEQLKAIEIALVKHAEYSRQDVAELPPIVKEAYDAAVKWLEDVKDGGVDLFPGRSDGCTVNLVRGTVDPVPAAVHNAEFQYVTQAGAGTYIATLGDSGLPGAIRPEFPGDLIAFGFRQYDSLSAGSAVIVPTIDGVAITDDLFRLTWDANCGTDYVAWGMSQDPGNYPQALAFSLGQRIGFKVIQTGSVPGSKGCKIILRYALDRTQVSTWPSRFPW